MQVVIDSITINETNRYNRIVADIDFYDIGEVVKEFGVLECVSALDQDDILDEIGFSDVAQHFSTEIQEMIDAAVEKALEDAKDTA